MTDRQTGEQTRRAVLGDAYVDRATQSAGSFGAPFQDLITRYAWGDVWSRPGLDRRTRSAITLALLTSLRAETELATHVRGALRNGLSADEIGEVLRSLTCPDDRRGGLSADEIGEVLLQTAIYAGVPAANIAFGVAERVLREEDALT